MKRLILILALIATPLWAVEPDEMLTDPVLEERAQALDEIIRCVQCQSEAISSSNADWAKDARVLVRDLISQGMSDDEVLDFFEERYGERVLMKPHSTGFNLVLWLAGPALLLLALIMVASFLRSLKTRAMTEGLTDEEQKRLDEILNG